jgi:hypothetical protein
MFGDVVATPRRILFGIRRNHGRTHLLTFPPVVEEPIPYSTVVDCSLDDPMDSLFTFRGLYPLHWKTSVDSHPCALFLPRRVLVATPTHLPSLHYAVYDPSFPAPFVPFDIADFSSWSINFGIPFVDRFGVHHVRCASPLEILRSFAFPEVHMESLLCSEFIDSVLSGLSSGLPFATADIRGPK